MELPGAVPVARAVLLADLIARQPLLALLNILLGGTMAVVYAPIVGIAVAGTWMAGMLVGQLGRLVPWQRYRRLASLPPMAEHWLVAGSAAGGLTWGVAGIVFFVPEPPAYQIFLSFVLGGMAAGAMIALPGHPPSFFTFLVPALLPYALNLLAQPDGIHRLMGIITLLFGAGVGVIGLQLARLFRDSARLSLENATLAHTLAEARDGLERDVALRTRELRTANGRLRDEIAQRRASEERVRHLLHHDPLTGLPNRLLFQDRLAQALAQASRSGRRVALMVLDLDGFKEINDTRGHPAGDRLLQILAARLKARIRAADTVARLGGDEFAVVQVGIGGAGDAGVLAEELLAALARPFSLDGEELVRSVSIGMSLYPDHGRDADTLLINADMALYAAKLQRNCWKTFTADMGDESRDRRQLDSDLQQAVAAKQFLLHYQPRYDLASRAMIGVEALVRWNHPSRGLMGPATFIPRAESTGLIRPLGRWVLEAACRQAVAWKRAGRELSVSVNLSPAQFRGDGIADMVADTLATSGLEAGALELEITETLYLEFASDAVYGALRDLRQMGVRLAIDDFGTGYSSLAYLRNLPFDLIKIDRAFVRNLGSAAEDEAIVHAVVTLVHNLGKRVVAEGVETGRQLSMLQRIGCDEAQGFYLAKPSPAAEI